MKERVTELGVANGLAKDTGAGGDFWVLGAVRCFEKVKG